VHVAYFAEASDEVATSNEGKHVTLRINSCVWASKSPKEFEHEWSSIISEFGLQDHDWLRNHYQIYASWIPAFFRDVFLFGILNTTSTKHTSLML
jgi:hypothetical protein